MRHLPLLIEHWPLVLLAIVLPFVVWKDRKESQRRTAAQITQRLQYEQRIEAEIARYEVSFEPVPLDGERYDWRWMWQIEDDWVWYFDGRNSEEHYAMRFATRLQAAEHFLRVMNPLREDWRFSQFVEPDKATSDETL